MRTFFWPSQKCWTLLKLLSRALTGLWNTYCTVTNQVTISFNKLLCSISHKFLLLVVHERVICRNDLDVVKIILKSYSNFNLLKRFENKFDRFQSQNMSQNFLICVFSKVILIRYFTNFLLWTNKKKFVTNLKSQLFKYHDIID